MTTRPDHQREIPSQPTMESIASRVRAIRKKHGWTLAEVETLSHGSIRAVVLGSYERGDRALSVKRAIQLADLYSVPLHYLLAEPERDGAHRKGTLILDLRKVRSTPQDGEKFRLLNTFTSWISHQRNDWNGEVMSLRESDLSLLALLLFLNESDLLQWLERNSFLLLNIS